MLYASLLLTSLLLISCVTNEVTVDIPFQQYTQAIPGSKVKFVMVPIPAGTYVQGSPASEPGRQADEGPTRQVEIKAFWMGQCEVTWNEYELFSNSTDIVYTKERRPVPQFTFKGLDGDAISRPTPPYTDPTFGYGHDKFPAMNVSHHAAMEYCRWLSAKTKVHYRLPTEAEWEYACRAETTTAYSFGSAADKLGDYAWFTGNADERPHPVGKKNPNPWGLHDMHGNVAEWCIDGYDAQAYARGKTDKATVQPVHLMLHARFPHVVRGGSWISEPSGCRSAARQASNKQWVRQDPDDPPSIWYLTDADFVGFRIVRAVDEQKELIGLKSNVTPKSPFKP